MKKFLLTLMCCVLAVCLHAETKTYTYDFSSNTNWVTTKNGTTNVSTGSSNKLNAFYYKATGDEFNAGGAGYFNSGYFLWGKSGKYIELPIFEGEKITNVTAQGNPNGSPSTSVKVGIYSGNTSVVSAVQWATKGAEYSYDIPESYQNSVLRLQVTSSHNAQTVKIIITTETEDTGGDTELADPGLEWSASSFAATMGESNVFPTLTNPNDLTVSYSSTNENVATIDSEGTINLISGGTTTITAETAATESFKAGKATFALTVVGKVATLTDFIAAGPTTSTIITEPVTVYYQSADKKYTFITDGTSYLQVYSATGLANTYNNGDQLTGISGTIGAYGGMAQMVPDADSFGAATAGTPIQPKVVTLAEEIAPSEYVTLSGVSITGVSGDNATLTDGTNTLAIYNRFALELTEVESATVVAIGAVYNGTKQVYIVSVTEEDVPVELGAIMANGSDAEAFSVVVNSEVVFSAKNAEKIVYSVNDAEVVESDTWIPTAVGDYTVKVSATLGDVTNSKTFSITVEEEPTTQTATIDFSAQGYANGTAIETVSNTPVTFTFNKGSNSNAPKYYDSGTAIRVYGGNKVKVSVTDEYVLTKIVITYGSSDGSNSITVDNGTFATDTWTSTTETSEVTFTVGGTSGNRRFQKMEVTYDVKGGSGEEPVVELGDILYNGLYIYEGHQWSTTLGETITISAENAETMTYSINGGDAIIVEGSSFTWTAEAAGHYAFTVSATLGNETKQIEFTVEVDAPVVELGEIMYDGVVVDSNITHVAYIGVPVTISAENAESMSYTVNGGEATMVEGSSFTWTAAEAGEYPFSVTATLGNQNKTVGFTVFVSEAPAEESVGDSTIDGLTLSDFGTFSGNSYKEVTYNSEIGFTYSANMAGGEGCIQLRANNSNSGIIVSANKYGLIAKSATIVWNSNTADARVLEIYGKSAAYTSATELYAEATQGKELVEVAKADGDTQTFALSGDYPYIAVRSKSGALYLDAVEIEWAVPDPIASDGEKELGETVKDFSGVITFICNEHAKVYYSFTEEYIAADPDVEPTVYNVAAAAEESTFVEVPEGGLPLDTTGILKYYTYFEDLDMKSAVKTIRFADTTGIIDIESREDEPAQWYDLNGRLVAAPGKGIYILKQGSKATKYAF